MKPKRHFQLLVIAGATALGFLGVQGCASGNSGPFHIYDSPLLAGQVEARYPRTRSFHPFELGDHNPPSTAYAANEASNGASSPAESNLAARPGTEVVDPKPALAANRATDLPHRGAPADTPALSARASSTPAETAAAAAAPTVDGTNSAVADYIWSVYSLNGVEFPADARQSVPTLFRACKDAGRVYHASMPAIGDIVFFHNTADINSDGRNNDWYTYAAIVEAHGKDGKISLLGYQNDEVRRFTMNLASPDAAMDRHGQTANTQLRAPSDGDAPFTQYLAGQLFAGTCNALGERAEFIIVDNWEPGMNLAR